ncbi:MAG: DUF4190 domain-containing protein [Pirellulaceae bacterium]|nr:DUF4190 domain-containing protein [Pirellulaceae bacterium]
MSYGDPSTNPYQSSTPGYMPPPQAPGPPVLAIISLVCGVLGIVTTCCCGILGIPVPIIAIICGGIALAQPNAGGKGMAIGGVALGVICLLAGIGLLILVLMNPDFANELQKMQQLNK